MHSCNWSRQDFLAYVLLFAAHCNDFEDPRELEYILDKLDATTFRKIHIEVVLDSTEESLNKIQEYLQENKCSQIEKEALIRHIKNVLFADGSVDIHEKNIFSQLKKIIHLSV